MINLARILGITIVVFVLMMVLSFCIFATIDEDFNERFNVPHAIWYTLGFMCTFGVFTILTF